MNSEKIKEEISKLYHEESMAWQKGDYKTALMKAKEQTLLTKRYGR